MSSFFLNKPKTMDDIPLTNIECMVDLETMGLDDDAPIITIGAVLFDPRELNSVEELQSRAFLRRIDVEDAVNNSGGVNASTLKWWLQQEDAAIKALVEGDAVTLHQALVDFRQYCVDRGATLEKGFFEGWSRYPQACKLWAKSPDFDCKKLLYGYKAINQGMAHRFYTWRCVRTIQDLAWPGGPDDRPEFAYGTAHDASADAVNQALMVQAAYKELGLSNCDVKGDTW